ncbi:ABC transporter substrate-binding protein [Reyranella soli]|jgi:ABC-type branched-subunit amino acid transport system substrate-binding protein|uniref:Branched-chain amino acid ABC transporter substrate-binding protein n=1 Tax=Reyranella soli TaxID=1230389 RepID=A0A512N998_9HYPH|nr:ABC transporter substrate-binding protein [Reyranella soli]GEP55552.1 branched-chain amino acid ABC transporter substrate-binding protein [Reyranella soli]
MKDKFAEPVLSRRAVLLAAGATAVATVAARAEEPPVKVGMSGPFSGGLSLLGQGVRDGVEVAFAEINAQGGVGGRKLVFIAEDDAYEPMRTIAAARKLVEQDKVAALLAVTGTAPSAALLPFVTESKTPLLFPYAFSHSLTTPVKRDVFTTLPEVRVQMRVLANYILKTLKQTKVAAIYQNDDFGQDAVAGLEERFGRDKIPLVKLPFDRGTTNFSGVVAQAKAAGVEHIVFLGIPKDAALVMREANNLGWKPQFSGHNALGDPQTFQLAGPLAEGALAVAVMEPLDSDKPAVKAFIEAQKKYKSSTKPTTYSMHGYQSGKLLAEVLKRSGGKSDEPSLVAALEGMKGYDTGLMAPITFSPQQHAGALAGAIMKAEGGKWKLITGWLEAD